MISIIIPNFNGKELLKKNLPKVFRSLDGIKSEVIVVDDCSTDDSINILRNMRVRFLRNNKNLGFSSTVNKGVLASRGDIIVLLNTDAWPEKNFLDNLSSSFRDKKVFAVGFLDKSIENGKTILRGRGVGKWQKGFLVHARGDIDKTNTLWASGGSSAYRKNTWIKLGGLDEIYNPFYWEDIDLSYRALKSGYEVKFDSKIVVYHEHAKGAIKSNYSEFDIRAIAYRNQFIFAWKNGTDLILQLNQFLFLPYHFTKALLNKDWTFFVGFLRALSIFPKIVKSSLKAQELFIKGDAEIIKDFKE